MKTAFGYFQYFSLFFLSISIFWNYILKNCKLRFIFPNSLSSCILGLLATKILIRSVLCLALFNFLWNHFVAAISYWLANLISIQISTNTVQSLGLIVVITLLNFTRIILAITIHLGGILIRKIMLRYIQK